MLQFLSGWLTRWRGGGYLSDLYTEMHSRGAFAGTSWRTHLELLRRMIPEIAKLTILDYGCGPKGGLREAFGDKVICYDPFIAEFSTPPWDYEFDAVFSSDVLEHMAVKELEALIARLRSAKPRYIFLNVSTRPAEKRLPNGANAHLTIKPANWWLRFLRKGLGPAHEPILAECDLLRHEGTFCFRRDDQDANGRGSGRGGRT